LGNFQSSSSSGQVALKIRKGGAFSGSILTPRGRAAFREKFSTGGGASAPIPSLQGTLSLEIKTKGLDDGKWDSSDEVYITAVLRSNGVDIPLQLRPTARKGGPIAPLAGSRINTLLESLGKSGVDFGHGFAGISILKNGGVKFVGALADGTRLSGSARLVEDGLGGWRLPVALPLASVKGFLLGEAVVVAGPAFGGFHLQSSAPWTWTRPRNDKAKSYASGFTEELSLKGRAWDLPKGESALGGNGGNFTIQFPFSDKSKEFVLLDGLGKVQGSLGTNNKPVLNDGKPPKGFTLKIAPSTGLFSGKVPGTLSGKQVAPSFQGVLFPIDYPLTSGGSVRGAGFVTNPSGISGSVFLTAP
jgi:hypothetical protein